MLQIRQLTLGPLQTNCYILGCEETLQCAIIDPAWNGRSIVEAAETDGWMISHILLTHSHFDHVGGLEEVKEVSGAPIFLHPDATEMLSGAPMSAAFFGVRMPSPPPPDDLLSEGQQLHVGKVDIKVILAPGHAPGHVAFYVPDYQVLFGGDVLFQGGIGRTDLPGGDYELLMQSISQKFLTLPDDTKVFPGHGPATSIEQERLYNPFVKQFGR